MRHSTAGEETLEETPKQKPPTRDGFRNHWNVSLIIDFTIKQREQDRRELC